MENGNRLGGYLAVLEIRRRAYRRNVLIAGGMLLLSILFTSGTLLLTDWNERSIWLMGVFDILFAINFLMTWARHEITSENIELAKNLQAQD